MPVVVKAVVRAAMVPVVTVRAVDVPVVAMAAVADVMEDAVVTVVPVPMVLVAKVARAIVPADRKSRVRTERRLWEPKREHRRAIVREDAATNAVDVMEVAVAIKIADLVRKMRTAR